MLYFVILHVYTYPPGRLEGADIIPAELYFVTSHLTAFCPELVVRIRRCRYYHCRAGFCYSRFSACRSEMVFGPEGYRYRLSHTGFYCLACLYFLPEMVVGIGRYRCHRCRAESCHLSLLCFLPQDGIGNLRIRISPFLLCILLLCTSVLSVRDAHENHTL